MGAMNFTNKLKSPDNLSKCSARGSATYKKCTDSVKSGLENTLISCENNRSYDENTKHSFTVPSKQTVFQKEKCYQSPKIPRYKI